MNEKYKEMFELDDIRVDIELAKLRKSRSWLAEQLGMTRQRYGYYHNSRSIKYVDEISDIFGVKVYDLLTPIE